jgi:hypothetical protein
LSSSLLYKNLTNKYDKQNCNFTCRFVQMKLGLLHLRKEHRLRLRTGCRGKYLYLRGKKQHDLHCSQNVVIRVKWTEHGVRM